MMQRTYARRSMADGIDLLIVEDHAMIAQGLRAALDAEHDMSVVGVAGTLGEGERIASSESPDVVVLDSLLPDGEAPTGIGRITTACPTARIVVVSANSDYRSVVRALEAGAAGYLLKDQPFEDLVSAIRTVYAGERALAPTLVPKLLAGFTPPPGSPARLSPREIEVLQLLAEGLTTNELARRLNLSVNTVRNHVQSILTRTGAHSKLEAVAIALREGIIEPPNAARRER